MPHPPLPPPPPNASPLYLTLRSTAIAFVKSTEFGPPPPSSSSSSNPSSTSSTTTAPPPSTRQNHPHILSLRTPTCLISFGHALSASSNPATSRTLDNAAFLANMSKMIPYLASSRSEVHDVMVDEQRLKVVVVMSFWMTVMGAGVDEGDRSGDEEVENEMVWVLEMEEGGGRVQRGVEWLDGGATERIKLLVGKVREGRGE